MTTTFYFQTNLLTSQTLAQVIKTLNTYSDSAFNQLSGTITFQLSVEQGVTYGTASVVLGTANYFTFYMSSMNLAGDNWKSTCVLNGVIYNVAGTTSSTITQVTLSPQV